jgi:hypothetical protein
MILDKKKLRDIILEEIKVPGKGKGIRACAYILKRWGYEVRESKGRRTRDGDMILPGASADKVWINTLAQYSSVEEHSRFTHWYWVGIPKDIAEKILVFGMIPKLIPETTSS